jgi:tRNA threonylcarbamoyladenosine biosynthesis protein TsaE
LLRKEVNKLEIVDVTLEQLPEIAAKIASFAENRSVWLLNGQMGAGKTTFIKALCQLWQTTTEANSPSYSIVNEYETINGKTIYHFDCYRLNNEDEAYDIGLEEYIESGNICLIEWSEKIPSFIPTQHLLIQISLNNNSNRIFSVYQNG